MFYEIALKVLMYLQEYKFLLELSHCNLIFVVIVIIVKTYPC